MGEAVAVAMLVDRGLVNYNDAVAKHWPEFGRHGKEGVTLADVMRHEAGLSYISKPGDPKIPVVVTYAMLKDLDALENTIANSGLNSPVGERHYHTLTRGWIVSAVLRRVDHGNRTLGMFLRDEVCKPLGITYFCGIPEPEQAKYNLADLVAQPPLYTKYCETLPTKLGLVDKYTAAGGEVSADKENHIMVPCAEWWDGSPTFNNTPEGRAAEIPSAGMYTNARSMAMVNACMANGGELGGVRIMSAKACADSVAFCIARKDNSLKSTTPFSQAGFGDMGGQTCAYINPSFNSACNGFFGWCGMGGSMSIFHPEKHVAVSYTMTGMHINIFLRLTNLMRPLNRIISQ